MTITAFNKLMTHDITMCKKIRDGYGNLSITNTSSIKGFVEKRSDFKIQKDNEIVIAGAIVYLKSNCGIDTSHEYWTLNDLEVLKIDTIDDPRTGNTHHYEIYCR